MGTVRAEIGGLVRIPGIGGEGFILAMGLDAHHSNRRRSE